MSKQASFNETTKHRNYSAPNNDHVILSSKRVEEFDHGLALRRIGKAPTTRTYIIGQMSRIGGAGNDGRHRCVAEQKFQKELRPGRRVEFGCPFRHGLAAN